MARKLGVLEGQQFCNHLGETNFRMTQILPKDLFWIHLAEKNKVMIKALKWTVHLNFILIILILKRETITNYIL